MHTCPECGQACYCHGDIDDCAIETEEAYLNCTHYESSDCPRDVPDEDEEGWA